MMSGAPKPDELTPEQQKTMRERFLSDAEYVRKGRATAKFKKSDEYPDIEFRPDIQAREWKEDEMSRKQRDFYRGILEPIKEKTEALNETDKYRVSNLSYLEGFVLDAENSTYSGERERAAELREKCELILKLIEKAQEAFQNKDENAWRSIRDVINLQTGRIMEMSLFLTNDRRLSIIGKIEKIANSYSLDEYSKYSASESDARFSDLVKLAKERAIADRNYDAIAVEIDPSVEGGFKEKK